MSIVHGRTWLEYLGEPECWRLLSDSAVGRIGVLVNSAPEIYPVNHVVDGETLVFRTDGGNKLRGIDRSPSVCYEVDGFDVQACTGWSVLVKGRAVELSDPEELARVTELPLRFWAIGDKAHWVRVIPAEVTGRRINRSSSRSAPASTG